MKDLIHSLNFITYTYFPYTHYTLGFKGNIDYVFFESESFEFERDKPIPRNEKIIKNKAMPSRVLPSDHIALVFDLKIMSPEIMLSSD